MTIFVLNQPVAFTRLSHKKYMQEMHETRVTRYIDWGLLSQTWFHFAQRRKNFWILASHPSVTTIRRENGFIWHVVGVKIHQNQVSFFLFI